MGLEITTSAGDTTITSLAANLAVNLDSGMTNRSQAYLLKKARSSVVWNPEDIDDVICIVLGYGDPSVAEIGLAMFSNALDPASHDDYLAGQQSVRRVIDFRVMPGGSQSNALGGALSLQIDWDLPSKGIPFAQDDGPQLYIWNLRTTATSGSATAVNSVTRWWGALMK